MFPCCLGQEAAVLTVKCGFVAPCGFCLCPACPALAGEGVGEGGIFRGVPYGFPPLCRRGGVGGWLVIDRRLRSYIESQGDRCS